MPPTQVQAVFLDRRPMLLRLLAARLGNADEAEDALHEMWLKVDALPVQPIAQPAAFLYRMAANLATDRRIAAQRRGARDTAWFDVQSEADDIPDAERAMLARDRLRTVQHAIAAMPERMRTALIRFRIEGRPQRAIAEELGISVSGVEKLLSRAYQQIVAADRAAGEGPADRRRLEGEGGADHDD